MLYLEGERKAGQFTAGAGVEARGQGDGGRLAVERIGLPSATKRIAWVPIMIGVALLVFGISQAPAAHRRPRQGRAGAAAGVAL